MEEGTKFRFKIAFVGNFKVGKSTLMRKFTTGSFDKAYVKTIGAQFSKYDKEMGDDKVRLMFWNIAGEDEFHFLRPSFFHNSTAVIIVYSLEDNDLGRGSFDSIPKWQKKAREVCGDIPIYIFANKADLVDADKVDEEKLRKVVKEYNFSGYFITSSKTGKGVIDSFDVISTDLYKYHKDLSSILHSIARVLGSI